LNLDVSFNDGAHIQTKVDFLRHGSVSNGMVSNGMVSNGMAFNGMARVSFERASGKQDLPEADRTFGARRPRYPLSSCVPAELDSVSPGYRSMFDQRLNRKIFGHRAMPQKIHRHESE